MSGDTLKKLAQTLKTELKMKSEISLNLDVVQQLVLTTYQASLVKDEGREVVFDLVLIDPNNPDPSKPDRVRHDRWTSVPLSKPEPFNMESIKRLALTTDRKTSTLAVYPDKAGRLVIWGYVDQGIGTDLFKTYESYSGFAHAGYLHVSAKGPGHLVFSIEFTQIAELRVDKLIPRPIPVLNDRESTVIKALNPSFKLINKKTKTYIKENGIEPPDSGLLFDFMGAQTAEAISRLLRRIEGYAHGGALLISPPVDPDNIKIKHKLEYERLANSIIRKAMLLAQQADIQNEILTALSDLEEEHIPRDLYLDESIISENLNDATREVTGSLWFTSLLSRADGLVLMGQDMNIIGFGAEILVEETPKKILLASDAYGTNSKMTKLDYEKFGTRHRSMFRYCNKVPGAIGFVISQDGGIKAVTKSKGSVVVWDNIRVHLDSPSHYQK